MLKCPYRIFSGVCIFKCRLCAIDCYGCNSRITCQIGKCYISDRTLRIFYILKKNTGIICFHGSIGSFLVSVESVFLEGCSCTGRCRSCYKDNALIRSANLFPVCCLSCEDVDELLFCKILNAAFFYIVVYDRSHCDYAYLMINKLFCLCLVKLCGGLNIGVTDIYGSLGNLL